MAQITHITQNNTPHSNKAQHTKLHDNKQKYTTVRAAAHQVRQDKHQDMTQKRQKLTSA
jgi:hypothetical protein